MKLQPLKSIYFYGPLIIIAFIYILLTSYGIFYSKLWGKRLWQTTSPLKYQHTFFSTFLSFYIITQCYYIYGIIAKHENVSARSDQISQQLPKHCEKILAPASFVFNQITNYHFDGYLGFIWRYSNYLHQAPDAQSFFEFASAHDYRCIIVDLKTNGDFTSKVDLNNCIKFRSNNDDYFVVFSLSLSTSTYRKQAVK